MITETQDLNLQHTDLLEVEQIALFPFLEKSKIYLKKPSNFLAAIEVVGCFLEFENKILLLHRQDHTSQGNLWGIPGGKIEKLENPIQAAVRETNEETGFTLHPHHVSYLGKVFIKYPKNDFVYHMVKASPTEHPGSVKINFNEHKGFTWTTPQDALKMNLMLEEDACIEMVYNTNYFKIS